MRQTHRPTTGDREALESLLDDSSDELSEWETHFLESLVEREQWTVKQGEKFDEVYTKHMG